jgi:2,4-dienoyl-CoA reductase-like NADH-dependent reductase (Old Yellow Enzyme family)
MSEKQATWSFTDVEARGIPTKRLINLYRRWAEGGYGLVLTGNTMIEYDQLESPGNLVIPNSAPFSGERFEKFKDLAIEAKSQGGLIVAQVSHPGRQAGDHLQKDPVSASDVQLEV